MARSGGGGSRGGGSRGGGSRGGSRGGRSNSRRTSRTRFPGAMRYSYLDRHGNTQYIYTDRPMKKQSVFSLIFTLFFLIPFIFPIFMLFGTFSNEFLPPKPLVSNVSYETSYITDTIDVIDNERAVTETLRDFHQKTGICPHVLTLSHDDWVRYDSLENYSLEKYYDMFYDEEHFLLVYSEYYYEDDDYLDWSWECIIGDDTIKILSDSKMNKFNDDFYEELSRSSTPLSDDLITMFSDAETRFMKGGADVESLLTTGVFILIWGGVVVFAIISVISSFITSRRDYTYAPEDDVSKEAYAYNKPTNLMMNGEFTSQEDINNILNIARERGLKVVNLADDQQQADMDSINTNSYPTPDYSQYTGSDYTDTSGDNQDPWDIK